MKRKRAPLFYRTVYDEDALDDARHAFDIGILAGFGATSDSLRATGQQVVRFAIEPLARRFGG